MFDPTAKAAAELLSYFGKNTAIRIDHKYGTDKLCVVVARTGNVISELDTLSEKTSSDLYLYAVMVMSQKRFPKPRNMKRSWSPIRLTEAAKAEAEIRYATINGQYED